MKKLISAVILAASLSLGACATTGTGSTGLSATDITNFENAIIADSLAVCQFEPDLAAVASLVANTVVPGASAITSLAATLANSLCASATSTTKASVMRGGSAMVPVKTPSGATVMVTGHFVGK